MQTHKFRCALAPLSLSQQLLGASVANCTMKSADNVLVDADLATLDKPGTNQREMAHEDSLLFDLSDFGASCAIFHA